MREDGGMWIKLFEKSTIFLSRSFAGSGESDFNVLDEARRRLSVRN
jgi:hypothetical protein